VRQDVAQPHQDEQLQEIATRVEEQDLVPEPPSGELQPGEGVHRDGVGGNERADVTDDQTGVVALQKDADALAEGRDVGANDRTAEGQDGRARRAGRSRRPLGTGQPGISFRWAPRQDRPVGRVKLIALPGPRDR